VKKGEEAIESRKGINDFKKTTRHSIDLEETSQSMFNPHVSIKDKRSTEKKHRESQQNNSA